MTRRLVIVVVFGALFIAGCPNNKSGSTISSLKKPFDAMPEEGWATDPNFSYRMYSYYPIDYTHGGVYQPYYHMPFIY